MKARFLALAALVLGLASCQTEPEGLNVNAGGEVDSYVTVSIPETETRANSALGAFDNVVASNEYTIRYIFEVYYGETGVQKQVYYTDKMTASFPVRLVPGRHYNFGAWADIVAQPADAKMGKAFPYEGNTTDVHYNTTNLKAISLLGEWKAMDETRDAFTGYFDTSVEGDNNKYTGTSSINIQMTRPFAKLRVITTDMVELTNLGITPTSATVKYNTNTNHYQSFNAVAGKVVDTSKTIVEKTHTFNYADVTAYESTNANKVLFTDYFFATDKQEVVNFTLAVKDQNNVLIGETINFSTPIPAQRNYLTTITGDILTDGNNVKVTVENDGKFEGENVEKIVEVGNATDLKEAINESTEETTIVFSGNIDLGNLVGILSTRAATTVSIVIPEGKVVALDLNGFNLTTPFVEGSDTNHTYAFENHGSLTIQDSSSKGNGQIIARGIFNYGTMTLKSGIINACDGNGGYGVRNYDGAEFIMNGGSIVTSYEDGDKPGVGYDASPVRVDEGATATINGGAINNVSNFTVAIDNYGTTTINNGTFTTIHTTIANSASMTINGGSFTCNGLEGVTAHALWAAAGTTTINDGTFNGKDNYNGFNVDADKGAIVNINGGKFLPVHSGSLYGEGTINVKGGTFFDQIAESRIDSDYKLVKSGENWIVTKKDPIAKIGDVEYTSLQKAVAAVQDGETITLVADEVFTEKNYYDNGGWKDGLGYAGDKSFTIDLNGKTVSQNGALNDYLIWVKNVGSKANTITIKNGTLDAGTTAFCALCTASSHDNQLTINLEDITLINENSNGSTIKVRTGSVVNVNAGTKIIGKNSYLGIENWKATVNIYDGAEIYMNGTSSYNGCLVGVGGNGTVNVYGGYGKGVSGGLIAMTSGGTINVSGGEWIANTDGTYANSNKSVLIAQSDKQYNAGAGNAVINVTGGTFKGGYNCYGNAVGDAQINIKGGNFNANPASYVVAGYESVEENGVYTVGLPKALADFVAAIAKGGNVTLASDVTLLETIEIENQVVIDLNGKTVTAPSFSAFVAKTGGDLTIKNGKVVAYESTVRAIGGKAVIESGEYTSTGTAVGYPEGLFSTYRYSLDCREGGELVINGGTFKSNNGMINVGSTVTINGGKFENIVEKTMTRHFAYVYAALTINDGEFLGKANSSAGGCFFCGAAAGCNIQVNGGKFTSLWTSGSVNRIFELYAAGGKINVTGGMFNTNGGIKDFVTENTDEATKAAYPYVAK